MPYHSFEHYIFTWRPRKESKEYPYYAWLAKQLQEDIETGILVPGTMLPPQREMAEYLDLSLSTVTKAYKLCEIKGLLFGIVGKGTFVADTSVHNTIIPPRSDKKIELGMTLPFYEHNQLVVQCTKKILSSPDAPLLFEYSNPWGTYKHFCAAQKLFKENGLDTDVANISIASGGQNALAIALAAVFQSGDCIATDIFTYPNFIGIAKLFGLKLVSVAGDEQGMLPDLLDHACKENKIAGIFLMPKLSNPTNITMGKDRKEEIARIISKNKLILLEDDTYAFLSDDEAMPISQILGHQFVYINSVSKSVCGGLRVAFLAYDPKLKRYMENAIYNINLKTASLNVEIVSDMILSDMHKTILTEKRQLAYLRNNIFFEYFPDTHHPLATHSFYHWISLPQNCSGKMFELLCGERGVNVYGSQRFSANEVMENAARIAISSPKTIDELKLGLTLIREVYDMVRDEKEVHIL